MTIILIALGWMFCGWLAYGATLGHFIGNWPDYMKPGISAKVIWLARLYAVVGPIGLISAFFRTWEEAGRAFHHGFQWRIRP